jgi:glycosyltransferase involved in cell wall biosynthesis
MIDSTKGTSAAGTLVSCLMVTLPVPERLEMAKRSIDDFSRQTLPNKALIVVMNGGLQPISEAICQYIAGLNRQDISVIEPPGILNLGQLRNISLAAASGDLICQWDDDDRFHPERLQTQATFLIENNLDAVYLQDVMQYFPEQHALFWTNWRATPALAHPGTLMARRGVSLHYPTHGDTARLGEDLEVARTLMARHRVGYLDRMPHLYVYISHGANSWNDGHHAMLRDQLAISRALLLRRQAQLRSGLEPYGFAANDVTLFGSNGEAFVL